MIRECKEYLILNEEREMIKRNLMSVFSVIVMFFSVSSVQAGGGDCNKLCNGVCKATHSGDGVKGKETSCSFTKTSGGTGSGQHELDVNIACTCKSIKGANINTILSAVATFSETPG